MITKKRLIETTSCAPDGLSCSEINEIEISLKLVEIVEKLISRPITNDVYGVQSGVQSLLEDMLVKAKA